MIIHINDVKKPNCVLIVSFKMYHFVFAAQTQEGDLNNMRASSAWLALVVISACLA